MIAFFKFPLKDTLGGAEIHTRSLASFFRSKGYRISLFTQDKKLDQLFETHNLPSSFFRVGPEPVSEKALLLWPVTYIRARRAFRGVLETLEPGSTLFLQSLTEKLVLTPLALARGHRVVWLEHKIPGRWLTHNPLLYQYRSYAKQVQVITVSEYAKKIFTLLGIPKENLTVIYPGIKKAPPIHQKNPNAQFNIGLLSRLDPEKGIFSFLKMITPFLYKEIGWKINIGGEGVEYKPIQQFIKNKHLEKQIALSGFIAYPDRFFSTLSVFVYPSLVSESFGLAAAEAQAHGIPVIVSNMGALPEVVQHNTSGFVCDPKKPREWYTHLARLAQNKVLWHAMSQEAIKNSSRFDEKKMFDAFLKIIKH